MFWSRTHTKAETSKPASDGAPAPSLEVTAERVLGALRDVMDPDLGMDVVALGMVGEPVIDASGVRVVLTPTTPLCPYTEFLVAAIRAAVKAHVPGVRAITIDVVYEPPWSASKMTAEARRTLGWDE